MTNRAKENLSRSVSPTRQPSGRNTGIFFFSFALSKKARKPRPIAVISTSRFAATETDPAEGGLFEQLERHGKKMLDVSGGPGETPILISNI
jgi:hypothetical protein